MKHPHTSGPSDVLATSGAYLGRPLFLVIGPSGVRALPLAAGRNEGGHYFWYYSFSSFGGTIIQNNRKGSRRVPKFCMAS